MPKWRILKKREEGRYKYYPQKRTWFTWRNITRLGESNGHKEKAVYETETGARIFFEILIKNYVVPKSAPIPLVEEST